MLIVAAVFDNEILESLFSNRRPPDESRLINGNTWDTAPPRLRKKYTLFRLKLHTAEPSIFAYLFLPLYERRLTELGIAEDEEETRTAVLNELLQIPQHDLTLAWIIAHKIAKFPMVEYRVIAEFCQQDDDDMTGARARQIEEDYQFAMISCAILNRDDEAVSRILNDNPVSIHRLSYCFGTTLFNFAVPRGSIETLYILLEYEPLPGRDHEHTKYFYDLLCLAMSRSESVNEAVALLFQHWMDFKTLKKRQNSADNTLQNSSRDGHMPIVDCVLNWLDQHWSAAGKKWFIENAFPKALRAGHVPVIERMLPNLDINGYYNPNLPGHYYTCTPLHMVVQSSEEPTLLRLLLEKGVDVNKPGILHSTCGPIFLAAQRGCTSWVEAFLQAGANPGRKLGEYPFLYYAERGGVHTEVSILLENYGWDREDLEDMMD